MKLIHFRLLLISVIFGRFLVAVAHLWHTPPAELLTTIQLLTITNISSLRTTIKLLITTINSSNNLQLYKKRLNYY